MLVQHVGCMDRTSQTAQKVVCSTPCHLHAALFLTEPAGHVLHQTRPARGLPGCTEAAQDEERAQRGLRAHQSIRDYDPSKPGDKEDSIAPMAVFSVQDLVHELVEVAHHVRIQTSKGGLPEFSHHPKSKSLH